MTLTLTLDNVVGVVGVVEVVEVVEAVETFNHSDEATSRVASLSECSMVVFFNNVD